MTGYTKVADVIVPEVFNPYVIERTAELSALVQSGIIETGPELDKLASGAAGSSACRTGRTSPAKTSCSRTTAS